MLRGQPTHAAALLLKSQWHRHPHREALGSRRILHPFQRATSSAPSRRRDLLPHKTSSTLHRGILLLEEPSAAGLWCMYVLLLQQLPGPADAQRCSTSVCVVERAESGKHGCGDAGAHGRQRFLAACARLARFRWKAILVEATLEDIKGGFEQFDIPTEVHPNAVCGTLDAIEAKFGIPVIYTSTFQDLATERAASWLSKHFIYWWLEDQGHGRVLIDTDGL